MHPSFMSMSFEVHSVSRTDANTATIFQPQYIPTRELAKGRGALEDNLVIALQTACTGVTGSPVCSIWWYFSIDHGQTHLPLHPFYWIQHVSPTGHTTQTQQCILSLFFCMKFKKKILISVCKALVGIKIRVKTKPSICLTGYDGSLTGSTSCLRRSVLQVCYIQCWWLRANTVMKYCWAIIPVATCL